MKALCAALAALFAWAALAHPTTETRYTHTPTTRHATINQQEGDTTMGNPQGSRDSQGHFIRSNREIEHDAEAARLRGEGLSYAAIGREMGISKSHAWEAVQRAFRATLAEPAEQARAVELARLENAHDAALTVLLREHLTVSHGRLVKDDDGNPIIDDAPVLQAIDRIRALSESRRKLLGLDAPSRVSVDAEHLGQEIAGLLDSLTQAATDDQPST